MDNIRDQRAIIDRRALAGRLAAIGEADRPAEERAAVLAELKSALATGRAEVRRRFEGAGSRESGDGRQAIRELSFLIDQLLRTLLDLVGERLHEVGTSEGVDRVGRTRLMREDLLGAKGDSRGALGWQRECLVEAVRVQ